MTCARRILLAVFTILAAAPAKAQQGDVHAGRQVAEWACKGCHAIERGQQSMNADVPSFPVIAARPGRTAERIEAVILSPHAPMPTLPLSTREVRDVAAYILSLK